MLVKLKTLIPDHDPASCLNQVAPKSDMRAIVGSSDGGRTPRLGRVKVRTPKVSKIIIAGNRILAEMPNLVIIGAKLPFSEL